MLILRELEAAQRDGKLVAARPIAPWVGKPRAFLMCPPLTEAIAKGRASEDEKERQKWAQVEADIGSFVEGALMTEAMLKQLKDYKNEHWEMRCRRPKPSLRIFGRFACPDVFVGTHVGPRAGMGGMWSAQFEYEKLVCEDHWRAAGLSSPYSATGFEYSGYITENARRKLVISA